MLYKLEINKYSLSRTGETGKEVESEVEKTQHTDTTV